MNTSNCESPVGMPPRPGPWATDGADGKLVGSIIDANPRDGVRLAVRASHEAWKVMIANFKNAQDSNAKFAAKASS